MKKHNDEHIGSALNGFLTGSKRLSNKYINNQIKVIWKEEMGELVNSYTEDLVFDGSNLFIYLSSAALKNELALNKKKIIGLIHRHFKSPVIKEVIIK